MDTLALGFCVGLFFGGFLFLSGLANPDKIIGTLRLKDLHALRVILLFLLVGMVGTWLLGLGGWANLSIKPASLIANAVGGALLGIGFGMTGFCPGTGLACMVSGRIDALVTVIGMLLGALVYILTYPLFMPWLDSFYDYGKATLPEVSQVNPVWWVLPIALLGAFVLWLVRPRQEAETVSETSPEEARMDPDTGTEPGEQQFHDF